MVVRSMSGAEVDECFHCKGIFLDAGEADATGLETTELFGLGSRPAGGSDRICPCGSGTRMTRFQVGEGEGAVIIERSPCCGGVFLDTGEHELLRCALGAFGSAALPPPSTPQPMAAAAERRCPRCRSAYGRFHDGAIEIDRCGECSSIFLDPGEVERRGVDVAAVFGVGPEAAIEVGPSELGCPVHGQPMVTVHVQGFAGAVEIERTTCCGGLYFDGGEYDAFVRAARRATTLWADRKYAETGQVADPTKLAKAVGEGAHQASVHAVKAAADRVVVRMADQARRRTRFSQRRRGPFDDQWW
jgi:Zn-finger nucleic acid-binding protein